MIPRYAFAALLALLAVVAVPFGANRTWAWALMTLVVGIMLISMALAGAVNPATVPVPWKRYRIPAIGYLVVLVWTLVQASTLTPDFLHHPLWVEASALLNRPVAGAISLDPPATLSEATRFVAYGGIFWLAMQFAGRDGRARVILWTLLLAATANAIYGLIVQFSGSNTILWFAKWSYRDVVTGTFVNRNHFATYLGLAAVVCLAFLIEELRRMSAGISLRTVEGLIRVSETVGLKFCVLAAVLGVLGLSIILTGSRGALSAIAVGIAALLGGIALSSRVSGDRVLQFGIVLAAAGVIGVALSGGLVIERLSHTAGGLHERLTLFGATADAIAERPIAGTGPGTFADVFLGHRPESFGASPDEYDHAHNTYLEVALESGIPALVVLLLITAYGVTVFVRGVRTRQRNDLLPAIGIGATALVATHALFDFSIEIPAVAATYLAIAGVAYAQSFSHAERVVTSRRSASEDERTRT